MILLIVSLVIVTPISLYSVVDPLTDNIAASSNNVWANFGKSLKSSASPLSLALCNAVIIPFLVDIVAMFQYKQTKSTE